MAWRYRDRESKAFVSVSTYKRSKSHGGTRFERVSVRHSGSVGSIRKTSNVEAGKGVERTSVGKKSKPDAPKTFREYQDLIKAKKKRKRADYYDDYDSGPEYETGVDY